jgi:hypothetical protein
MAGDRARRLLREPDEPRHRYECTSASPMLDVAGAIAAVGFGGYVAVGDETCTAASCRPFGGWFGADSQGAPSLYPGVPALVAGAALVASAIHGYVTVGRCERRSASP